MTVHIARMYEVVNDHMVNSASYSHELVVIVHVDPWTQEPHLIAFLMALIGNPADLKRT
jgi:hypothetical protein